MKRVILAMACCALISSCSKSTKNVNPSDSMTMTDDVIERIAASREKKISENTKSSTLAYKTVPSAGRAVAADACGALSTCALGPWFCFAGAFSYSVYDLFQQGAFLTIANGGVGGNTSNPNNPFDYIGSLHNSAVYNFIYNNQNVSLNQNNMGTVNSFALNTYSQNYPVNQNEISWSANFDFITGYNSDIDTVVYDSLGIDGLMDIANQHGYITANESAILKAYFNGMNALDSLNDIQDFSIDCEDIVANSNLGSASIDKLLMCMAVARNSVTLYFGKGIK